MNTIFSCNVKAKYSTKDIYLDEKGPSLKLQLSDIFKDHHIVAKPSITSVGYDEWPLSNALLDEIL